MKPPVSARRGFSLIEVLVVIAILAALVSMAYSALRSGRTMSKQAICLNNLKQIAVALNLYYNDHKAYPPENLPGHLARYTGENPRLFVCPNDQSGSGDSYSQFYVARPDDNAQDYVCACPRHVADSKSITLLSSSSAQLLEQRPVHWNGQVVAPGTSVGSGVMSFGDGSTVTIPDGMVVRLVQSFRLHDGRYYSVIAVDINETGTLEVEVTPGSRFEVVTPSAIAGVQGTRFKVTTYIENEDYCVKVEVSEGKVGVKNRWEKLPPELIEPGKTKRIKLHRGRLARLLRRWWKWRRKHLPDDWLYDPDLSNG